MSGVSDCRCKQQELNGNAGKPPKPLLRLTGQQKVHLPSPGVEYTGNKANPGLGRVQKGRDRPPVNCGKCRQQQELSAIGQWAPMGSAACRKRGIVQMTCWDCSSALGKTA